MALLITHRPDLKYNKTSEKLKTELGDIHFPIKVIQLVTYSDGGSVGIVIQDDAGAEYAFCRNGKLRLASDTDTKDTRYFINAVYPDDSSAMPVMREAEMDLLFNSVIVEAATKPEYNPQIQHEGATLITRHYPTYWEQLWKLFER